MELGELKNVENLFDELDRLRKRSELLENILQFYNPITGDFEVPEKWKSNHLTEAKLKKQPYLETPRTNLRHEIDRALTSDEIYNLEENYHKYYTK